MSGRRNLPVAQSSRAVGVRVGGQVYMPALPANGRIAEALKENLNAHYGVVVLLDHIYAAASALASARVVVHDPVAEREAEMEEREKVRHDRAMAQCRRERELHEARLEVLRAQHQYDAVEKFKEVKFGLGEARFKQKVAEAKIGEAVAREGMTDDILAPEGKPANGNSVSLAEQFARLVDDIEVQIEEAEASGRPTEQLRAEQNTANRILRRELLRGKP
jgi:hypothetical protein